MRDFHRLWPALISRRQISEDRGMNETSYRRLAYYVGVSMVLLLLGTGPRIAAQQGCATDPADDLFNPDGDERHDIVSVCAQFTATDLVLTATLKGPVNTDINDALFSQLAFELDTDQDGSTGINGLSPGELRCPDFPESLGIDFIVRFVSHPRRSREPIVLVSDVRDFTPPPDPWNPEPVEEVGSWSVVGKSVILTVPLASLGADDGVLDAHILAGTVFVATDCAPDVGFVTSVAAPSVFRRGDCNDDGTVDLSDGVCILGWLFAGDATPACVAATDANGDASTNLSDALYVLNYLFVKGGVAPVAPFPDCGPGTLPAGTELGCANPPDC